MAMVGVASTHTPTIKYQLGKATVVASAHSDSQCSTAEDSIMELAKNNLGNELYTLTSVTIERSEEDLRIWH